MRPPNLCGGGGVLTPTARTPYRTRPSCLSRQAIKRMETRDGVSRQLEYLLKM